MKKPPWVPAVAIPKEETWGYEGLDVSEGAPHANPVVNTDPAVLPSPEIGRPFRLLQYNVWFGNFENPRRMEYLGRVIEDYWPDVVCMQEVTDELLWHMGHSRWFNHYRRSHDRVEREAGYQEMIFSRTGFASVESGSFENTRMGRGWTIATVPARAPGPGASEPLSVCVGTSHLESLGGQVNAGLRQAQLTECLLRTQATAGCSAACGGRGLFSADTNMLPSDPDEVLPDGWGDAWRGLGLSMELEASATYNGRKNPVIMGDIYVSRLDRIYVQCREPGRPGIRPRACSIVGTEGEGGPPAVVPSDHYGLLLECDLS